MPGPCSAPNGTYSLTIMTRQPGQVVRTGKTALKRKQIQSQKLHDDIDVLHGKARRNYKRD